MYGQKYSKVLRIKDSVDTGRHAHFLRPLMGMGQIMSRTIAATAARGQLNGILDDAEKGKTTVILRHSRPSAAVVPANDLEAFRVFQKVMREVGETLQLSRDPEIVEAVKRSQDAINRGEIIWDDEAMFGEVVDSVGKPGQRKSRK